MSVPTSAPAVSQASSAAAGGVNTGSGAMVALKKVMVAQPVVLSSKRTQTTTPGSVTK